MKVFLVWIVMTVAILVIRSEARPADEFSAGTQSYGSYTIPYRIFTPAEYDDPGKESVRYPMMLTLHGGGGRGNDNWTHISYANNVAEVWALPNKQYFNPCFVLAPQNNTSTGDWLNLIPVIYNLIDKLIDQGLRIDTDRVYVCGISWGGRGTFHAMNYQGPKKFKIAAGIPMCGSSTVNYMSGIPDDFPIWNFHARNDNVVSVSYSRTMVSAFRNRGEPFAYTHCVSWPSVDDCSSPITPAQLDSLLAADQKKLYTELCCAGHALQNYAWAIPQLFTWVFAQNAGSTGLEPRSGRRGTGTAPVRLTAVNPADMPLRLDTPSGMTGGKFRILNTRGTVVFSGPVPAGERGITWMNGGATGGIHTIFWEGDNSGVLYQRVIIR